MTGNHRILVALVLALGLLLAAPVGAQLDDTALFSTQVPPNVVLMVDNSGSMHHIVWHPDFDPAFVPPPSPAPQLCNFYNDTSQYFYTSTFTTSHCGKTRTIYVDPDVSPGSSTRYWGYYLNWLFSDYADSAYSDIPLLNNGTASTCLGGGTYSLYRRSRVTAAKQILREVICNVNASSAVRFGIAKFRRGGDPEGGYVRVPANDYFDGMGNPNVYTLNGVTQSHGDHLDDAIDELTGEAWTPLSETLFQVYTYFMSRTTSDRPLGADGSTRFPEYEYRTDWVVGNGGRYSTAGPPTVPDSPVQWPCQKNFVVIITDGEPTKDDFDSDSPDDVGFDDFGDLIGDYNPGDETETGISCTGCNETTRYLDDIAKFMQENDFLPNNTAWPDEQTIDVYTVGFTTSAFADSILQKTATEGNGTFFSSNDAETLAVAIVNTVADIVRKSQAFTAPTVPASRVTNDAKLYTSYFVPSRASGFWEGHLASWTITLAGDVLDKFGNCALNDPDAGECNNGPFIPGAQPHWDAATSMPGPGSRNLYTSQLTAFPGVSQRIGFSFPTVEETVLGVVSSDLSLYPYPGTPAANENELAEMLVQSLRGCEFGTGVAAAPCVTRPAVLGDIFHSGPIVIPHPPGGSSDASYNAFAAAYRGRDRVIAAGANDGFFHLFHAGTWNAILKEYDAGTGTEIAGFMPYPARQNAKQLPIDSGPRDVYTADGSPTVADVWFYTNPTTNTKMANGSEWHTISVSGMRQGGEAYFALDVTDPASPTYPDYLWEFPREDAPVSITDYIGQSWSRAVVTKIRTSVNGDINNTVGYERWVAIFGGGYAPASDPNDHSAYDPAATEGRAIVILDLKTGEIIAMKKYDPAATDGQEEMLYAIPASPAVFDLDFDGFADVIYVGDLGGNVWKWVLSGRDFLDNVVLVEDVVNGTGSVDQPQLPFKKWFEAPIYDSGTNKYYKSFYNSPSGTLKSQQLYLVFGSGERSNLPFMGFTSTTDENNRLYSVKDLDPLEKRDPAIPTVTEADLVDLTTNTTCLSLGSAKGFFLMGEDGEKFVTETDILFFYVFAVSYKPLPSANPCETNGAVFLYAFKVHCGESLFEDTAGNPQIKIQLDESTPTTPTITVGDEVEIKTGSPDGVGGPPPPGLGGGDANGPAYWRELRFGQSE